MARETAADHPSDPARGVDAGRGARRRARCATGQTRTTTAATVPTETAPTELRPAGKYFPVEIRVGGRKVPVVACPRRRSEGAVYPIRVGDQLSLTVTSAKVAEIEIPRSG
jgi:hypothetical protein